MFITKKSLPRRTFLRGMGAAVALPLLDAMVPALTATAQTAANPRAASGPSTFRTARSWSSGSRRRSAPGSSSRRS